MNDRMHHLICLTMGTLLLGGCALGEEPLDELDAARAEQPEQAQGPDGLEAPAAPAQPHTLKLPPPGVDPECMDREAPVIGLLDEPGLDCALGLGPADPLWNDWQVTLLFQDGSPWLQSLLNPVPDQFLRYCKYDYIGDRTNRLDDYTSLVSAIDAYPGMNVDTIATDCLGVAPMAGLDDASVYGAFNEVFRRGVGAVSAAALAGLNYGGVRVGLLDSASEGETPLHAHAIQMRHLLEDLMCPGDPTRCGGTIHNSLVLPRKDVGSVDWIGGGNVGYATDFAAGALYEVQSWLDQIEDTHEVTRLVLAAPVGYDVSGTYATDPNRATTMAMVDVLKMASCYGALTLAAAGNLRPGTCEAGQGGLLAPSYFETLPAPDLPECTNLGYLPDWDLGTYPVAPGTGQLVYAVGGLTERNTMIPNGRPDSMPRMAANALAGAGDPSVVAVPSELIALTGTSVATVATAAAAGLAWTHDPSLTAAQLAQRLYDEGWATTLAAKDGNWPLATVRRLSICKTLRAGGMPLLCAPSAPDPATAMSLIAGATEAIVATEGTTLLVGGGVGGPMCQLPALDEVLRPQPDKPVCSMCSAGITAGVTPDDDVLYMTIEQQPWAIELDVSNAYLHVYDDFKNKQTITLDPADVAAINAATSDDVLEVNFDAPDTVAAELEFEYDDGFGNLTYQSNSIPVWDAST